MWTEKCDWPLNVDSLPVKLFSWQVFLILHTLQYSQLGVKNFLLLFPDHLWFNGYFALYRWKWSPPSVMKSFGINSTFSLLRSWDTTFLHIYRVLKPEGRSVILTSAALMSHLKSTAVTVGFSVVSEHFVTLGRTEAFIVKLRKPPWQSVYKIAQVMLRMVLCVVVQDL